MNYLDVSRALVDKKPLISWSHAIVDPQKGTIEVLGLFGRSVWSGGRRRCKKEMHNEELVRKRSHVSR